MVIERNTHKANGPQPLKAKVLDKDNEMQETQGGR